MVQLKGTLLVSMRSQVRSLALLSGLSIWCCLELQHRFTDMAQIWRHCGCGVDSAALIQPLAWDPPYAMGAVLKKKAKKKKKESILLSRVLNSLYHGFLNCHLLSADDMLLMLIVIITTIVNNDEDNNNVSLYFLVKN